MLIEKGLLSGSTLMLASLLAALAIALSIHARPWRGWLDDAERRAAWLGSLALLGAIWSLRIGLGAGHSLRFLLVTAVTLLHGWGLAILGGALVLAALSAIGLADWTSFGANLLCTVVVPALLTGRLHEMVHRRLPHNYFVYFFIGVFLGSALAWNAGAFARWCLLTISGHPLMDVELLHDSVAVVPLMTFGEAFLNGALMATAVAFRPHWVMSFDDRAYLAKR